jgi:hypothetical protein
VVRNNPSKERIMKSQELRSSILRVTVGVALTGVVAAGCGAEKPIAGSPVRVGDVPTTPVAMTGTAQVSGLVRDGAGNPVAGATIKVAEVDMAATSDAGGAYALTVPADSTLTLVTTAMGFATTFRGSMILAEGSKAAGFNVMLLTAAEVTRMNTQAATHGLVAVHLHSMNPACITAGARVSVWPPLAATIAYGRPSATGGLDEPDPALSGVEAGAHVDAWLADAIPPGNMFEIRVDQTGCTPTQAPSQGGLLLTGERRVDAQALTEIDLFLQ